MLKQVSINVNFWATGSKNEAWRPPGRGVHQAAYLFSGSLHQAGGRRAPWSFEVSQTRPLLSIIGLCGSDGL